MHGSNGDSYQTKSEWTFFALICGFAIFLFGSLLQTPYLTWHDDTNIFSNPYYQARLWWHFWTEPYMGMYTPVASTVWAAMYKLGDGAVWPFRLLNLTLHTLNICMLFVLLKSASRRWKLNPYAVLIAVTMFALHALQVHTVAWISGGRDLLAATFGLAAVMVYYHKRTNAGFSLATFFFLCALLSKPSTVILPLIILLLDWIINDKPQRHSVLKMSIWGLFSLAVIFLAQQAQQDWTNDSQMTFVQHVLVVLDTYGFYLQKILFPQQLSANYARTPVAALDDSTAIWSAILVVAMLASYGFLAWRTDRRYALVFTWFLALLPVSGIITYGFQKVSTVSDHYNYFPMAGLTAFIAVALSRLPWEKVPKIVPPLVLLLVICASAAASVDRLQVWRSDEAFFTDMAKTAPETYSTALGMSIVSCEHRQQFDEGVRWTEIALKEKPNDILALANQAYCFLHAKNYFRVIELEFYLGKLDLEELEVRQPTAYSSLLASIGTAYIEQREFNDGFQFLCEAYRVKPSEPGHSRNLEIAAEILKRNGVEPVCEDEVEEEDDVEVDGFPADVWPDSPATDEEQDTD